MTAIVSDYESRLEDIAKFIYKIADRSTPLLKRHLDMKDPCTAIKHEWVDKTLNGLMDTLRTTLASTTTTIITVNGGTDSPKRYIPNVTVLLIGAERLLVASIVTVVTNATVLNLAGRGYRSSTPATHAAGKQIKLLNSRVEGFNAGRDDSQKGVRQFNYTMIFERELKLSGSSIAVDAVGQENKLNKQAADLTPELLKEAEGALLYSDRFANGDLSDRSAGGFQWHATNRGAVPLVDQDRGGLAINRDLIEETIETYLKNGADATKLVALTSVRQQRKLNDIKEAMIVGGGMSQSEKNLNYFVNRYDFGTKAQVEIMFSTDVRDDEIFFYQSDLVKVKPLQTRGWFRKKLPEDGDFVREMIVGEYGFEFFNTRETLFHYNNLAV